jgi:hypothetical protein
MRWVVRDLPEDWMSAYGASSGVTELSAQQATLEEIFVSVCDQRAKRPQPEQTRPAMPTSEV